MILDDDDQHLSYLDLPQQQSAEVEPGRGFAEVPPLQGEAATISYLQVVFILMASRFFGFWNFLLELVLFLVGKLQQFQANFYTFAFKIIWNFFKFSNATFGGSI